ncbi:type II secretion system protein GspM [Ottowia thiooxydans]|uniref:type II secretion system protein GspM n=1 Tax=Ottowia thiooxydans TaxID=219182 RepID=UPI001FE0C404|nr:type II secretion system protein GspM [Ottowia thiooxydans]
MPSSPQNRSLMATWANLEARERRLVGWALAVVVLALLWWVALAPAIKTLRAAGPQRQALEIQAEQMQRLQAEAETLKALPKMGQSEALRALETAGKQRLGASGQLNVVGDRANVTLKDVPAAALAEYLADARANARAAPVEARLSRVPGAAPGTPARWNGTLSLSLPQP